MSNNEQSATSPTTWRHRFAWRISHRLWWWTSPVAWWVHRRVKWAEEDQHRWPRWLSRWPAGLSVACWTHVCGHGYRYSFDVGSIYWFPSYAHRRLRLGRKVREVLQP